MAETILVARDDCVLTITLNRPEAGNSFSRTMLTELDAAIAEATEDDRLRALVVTGAGERVFCAGADLKERASMTPEEALDTVRTTRETISALAAVPVPVIAAINGAALGGGTELALACDIRVCASTATLGLTETTLAIIPGGGGTQRLTRLLGEGRAKELIFTGRRVGAAEALRIGLVEDVVEPARLIERAREIAGTIAANGPIAVRAAKEAIVRGAGLPLTEALRLETELYERTIGTQDRLEGLAAFLQKRAPRYRGV